MHRLSYWQWRRYRGVSEGDQRYKCSRAPRVKGRLYEDNDNDNSHVGPIIWISLLFRHRLVYNIYYHRRLAELKPTYSKSQICFEIFYLIEIKILKSQSMYLENMKNYVIEVHQFHSLLRAQNCPQLRHCMLMFYFCWAQSLGQLAPTE